MQAAVEPDACLQSLFHVPQEGFGIAGGKGRGRTGQNRRIETHLIELGQVLEVVPEELLQNRLVGTDECFRGVDVVGEVPHGKKRRENVGVAQAVILGEVDGLT